jgi:2-oxoglutarate ferredoxin oxidoreductase subunit delta
VTAPRTARGTLVIDEERCKGCELCIAACPPRGLVMSREVNEMGYRYPRLNDGCTGCTACQMVCPDFVFSVYHFSDARAGSAPLGDALLDGPHAVEERGAGG